MHVNFSEQRALFQSMEWVPSEIWEEGELHMSSTALCLEISQHTPRRFPVEGQMFQPRCQRGFLWGFSLGRHDFELFGSLEEKYQYLREIYVFLRKTNIPLEAFPPKVDEKYGIYMKIGKGSYGKVFAAVHWRSLCSVAIKQIKTNHFSSCAEDVDCCFQELWLMNEITQAKRHGAVVNCLSLFVGEKSILYADQFHFIAEVVPLFTFTLGQVLRGAHRLPNHLISKLMGQLLGACAWLHAQGVYHRDIKPDNILLDNRGHALLTDYGLSVHISDEGGLQNQYVCSRPYRAPELLFHSTFYDDRIDSWSLGVVLAEMLLGKPLFSHSNMHMKYHIEAMIRVLGTPHLGELPYSIPKEHIQGFLDNPRWKPMDWHEKFPEFISPSAAHLLNELLVWNYQKRKPARDVLCHPFILYSWDPQVLVESVESFNVFPLGQPPFHRSLRNGPVLKEWLVRHGESMN